MPELQDRDTFEGNLARRLGATGMTLAQQLLAQLPDAADSPTFTVSQETLDAIVQSYTEALLPELEAIFIAGAQGQMAALGLSIDFDIVNTRAAEWARAHTFDLVRGISANSTTQLQGAVNDYFTGRTTLADLETRIGRVFGPGRAAAISVTETTRAAAQGEFVVARELQAMGVRTVLVWRTNADSAVCPLCGPRDGTQQGDGWQDLPPAHVGCRCWTSAEPVVVEGV